MANGALHRGELIVEEDARMADEQSRAMHAQFQLVPGVPHGEPAAAPGDDALNAAACPDRQTGDRRMPKEQHVEVAAAVDEHASIDRATASGDRLARLRATATDRHPDVVSGWHSGSPSAPDERRVPGSTPSA
jgi:hypothetical protein